MKFLVASIFAVYLLVGCQSGGHWTANELRDWYVKLEQSDPIRNQGVRTLEI